jgi:two-component system, sensor histidine kinase and response regulator
MARELESVPPILIVDDLEANLLAARVVLDPLGYPIVTASSGESALKLVLAQDVVLVLMDVHMPTLDGYETAALLRGSSRTREVPIVFLTAVYNQPEHTRRGYELGAADFVSKPFDPEVLRGKVRALISLYMRGQRAEKERSDQIDRVKDLFLGAVGHDLRNPLNTISMAAKMLRAPRCEDASRQDYAWRIERASSRMDRIIEDVLDLTRGQFTGGIPVSLEPTDLGDVCRAVISEFRISQPKREVSLDVSGDVAGHWDPARLARVVSNLVGNAIQHCAGVPVRVTVGEREGHAVLAVHNEGEAIPDSVVPKLFEPFRRGDTSAEGLGLGLYIVREIVRAHRGTVAVSSTQEEGTRFTVSLPKSPSSSPTP